MVHKQVTGAIKGQVFVFRHQQVTPLGLVVDIKRGSDGCYFYVPDEQVTRSSSDLIRRSCILSGFL